MPYIPYGDRPKFDEGALAALDKLTQDLGFSNGDFNYVITQVANIYLQRHGTSYNTIKDVIGAFECAKLEFYRRVASPYEDRKISQNGDVLW